MPALITNDHRILAADYFQNDIDNSPTYVYIGKSTEWDDESLPPEYKDSTLDKIKIHDDIIAMKKIQKSDMISVVLRIDWIQDKVFDEYDDSINMIDETNPETGSFYQFYVLTDEFNVYKCLSNNYRSPSNIKPSGTSLFPFQTPDGYKWKYMYTILSPDAFSYLTPNFMPCYSLDFNNGSNQWLVQDSAISGTIDNIVVTDNGINYSISSPPSVTIDGDGVGAQAVAVVDNNGLVQSINVINAGSGYTNATITISGTGVGAQGKAIVSPINGHGHNARSELGAIYKMIRIILDGDEGGIFPVDIEYRQAGIIYKPLSNSTNGIVLSVQNSSLYASGESVTGQTSSATGTISFVDKVKNLIYLINVIGSFINGEIISSQIYNEMEVNQISVENNIPLTDSVVNSSSILKNSGEILYISTREKVVRGANQSEELRFILSF